MKSLTQEQLLLILRQFHLVQGEWGGKPYHEEVETVQALHAQLNEESKVKFEEDCSNIINWLKY